MAHQVELAGLLGPAPQDNDSAGPLSEALSEALSVVAAVVVGPRGVKPRPPRAGPNNAEQQPPWLPLV